VFQPQAEEQKIYDELYALYRELYFAFGKPAASGLGAVLPALIRISTKSRTASASD
jgi:hypothetical protein